MWEVLKRTSAFSYFKHFHNDSPFAEKLFDEDSSKMILQIMKVDDNHYLAEIIDKNKYWLI